MKTNADKNKNISKYTLKKNRYSLKTKPLFKKSNRKLESSWPQSTKQFLFQKVDKFDYNKIKTIPNLQRRISKRLSNLPKITQLTIFMTIVAITMEYLAHASSVAQSCLTLCNLMDCSLPVSSVHEISQARILEWGATFFFNGIPSMDIHYM